MALPDLAREATFDSIALGTYAHFWDEWRLVTVRFRRDNGEQRFVFANAAATRAMRRKSPTYPDGAMFGKVAFEIGDDPSFPNSEEPRRFTRIQLMRKDSKLYSQSDGWGYAVLLAGSGVPYKEERSTVTACHTCHRLVPERDFVFSSPSFMGNGHVPNQTLSSTFKSRFKDQLAHLSPFQQDALALVLAPDSLAAARRIRSLSMDLFVGSVHESIGTLSAFAVRDGATYALWDEAHHHFAIVAPLRATGMCQSRTRFAITTSVLTNVPRTAPVHSLSTRVGNTCNGIWESGTR